MATVKDLTTALSIGREEGKKDALVAGKGGSPGQPYEIPRPDIPHPNPPKLAHGGPFYNEYGQTIKDPSKGWSHNGVPLPQIDHLKQTPEEMEHNEQIHEQNYPDPSHELKISQTRRDKAIRNIMNTYGKDSKGNYKDPSKLLSNLLTIAQV